MGNHLRLSTATTKAEEAPEAQGQLCKRERPNPGTLETAVPSAWPEGPAQTGEAVQPREGPQPGSPAPTPPIAQLTDGKLTIRATGQELSAVLDAVGLATGIAVDVPPGSQPEPVFMNLGPAPVKQALVALVEGTQYNYIIVGSPVDPAVVKQLILSARSSAAGSLLASTGAPAATIEPQLYGGQGVRPDPDAEAITPGLPNQQSQPIEVPSSVPAGINIQQLATQENKTPGQILDELQKRQLEVLDQQNAQSQPQ